jgi:phosphatidylinositol 4-kinase A
VKFEPSSFKLTHEMIVLMGGRYSQGYQLFQQLTIKAFLALRPYTDQLVSTVQLMLDTGLPSFKGEPTIKRLRDRFAPGLSERQAAEWMMSIVRNAQENVRSTVYDEFQRVSVVIDFLERCCHTEYVAVLFPTSSYKMVSIYVVVRLSHDAHLSTGIPYK